MPFPQKSSHITLEHKLPSEDAPRPAQPRAPIRGPVCKSRFPKFTKIMLKGLFFVICQTQENKPAPQEQAEMHIIQCKLLQ